MTAAHCGGVEDREGPATTREEMPMRCLDCGAFLASHVFDDSLPGWTEPCPECKGTEVCWCPTCVAKGRALE